ncbi:MAG: aspartyl-phosphate phosphatase Spo0E family protein [Caloramator sp.]|nr:aspartyl-phosphate phosphatase Spo0E family protein [Caloramator sp.]
MVEIKKIKNYIETKRKYLQELIKIKNDLSDEEIVSISQELDKAINLYYEIQRIEDYSYNCA